MKSAQMLVRAAGAVMLLLGAAIWTGQYQGLIPVHMLVGFVFVLLLWWVAYLAVRAGAPRAMGMAAVILGLVLPAFGLTQQQILVGDAHLVVQLVHLALGLAAIGLAEALAGSARRASAGRAAAPRRA